jgi:hypothetical protein
MIDRLAAFILSLETVIPAADIDARRLNVVVQR